MRSLAASNPFLSARESLMQLFDDAARKVDSSDQFLTLTAPVCLLMKPAEHLAS